MCQHIDGDFKFESYKLRVHQYQACVDPVGGAMLGEHGERTMISLKAESEKYKKEYPKRNVAMVGFIDEDGRVLLTRTAKLPQSWHAIGGGIDPNDKTLEAAVLREVKEELGVELNPAELKFIVTVPYDFGEGSIHYYRAPLSKGTLLHVDQNEIVEHKWFPLGETKELPMYNALRTFLGRL